MSMPSLLGELEVLMRASDEWRMQHHVCISSPCIFEIRNATVVALIEACQDDDAFAAVEAARAEVAGQIADVRNDHGQVLAAAITTTYSNELVADRAEADALVSATAEERRYLLHFASKLRGVCRVHLDTRLLGWVAPLLAALDDVEDAPVSGRWEEIAFLVLAFATSPDAWDDFLAVLCRLQDGA